MTKLKLGALLGALAVFTGGAAAATEIRVPVAGKSTEQVHADIVKAASDVCWKDVRGEPMAGYIYPQCVRRSVDNAVAQLGDRQLVAYNQANRQLVLASR